MPIGKEQTPISGAQNTCVVFGWNDDVIPVENGIRFAQGHKAELHIMDSGHRLDDVLDDVGEFFRLFLERLGLRRDAAFADVRRPRWRSEIQ